MILDISDLLHMTYCSGYGWIRAYHGKTHESGVANTNPKVQTWRYCMPLVFDATGHNLVRATKGINPNASAKQHPGYHLDILVEEKCIVCICV